MSTAREEVLARVRSATAGSSPAPALHRGYRLADDAPASLPLLVERLQDYRAVVHRVTVDGVRPLLARIAYGRVVVPHGVPEAWLSSALDVVRDEPPLTTVQLDGVDTVLTLCALAIAETGTVVLDGGPGQGRRALSLVPDHHVLVVRDEQVVATVPQAVARLDPRRLQTWISGPSATSDIELERVEGVHGPRQLEVLLVSAARSASPA